MASTLVYFVRHGQTAENLRGIIQGQLDTQLDETGRLDQAPAVAHALKDVPFDTCFTSDLARAFCTAEAILHYHSGVELHKVALLRERYMGNLQGQAVFPRDRRPPPDDTVESSAAFVARTLQFWDEVVLPRIEAARLNTGLPYNVLVVSHGAFIGTLARSLIGHRDVVKAPGVAFSWCPNVSITLVEVRGDGTGILLSFGDISHVMKPAVQSSNADELPVPV